ncbi:MAG: hypothetical protein JO104_01345 [Candidatus Eremiobacteraeota bacterium]|nr:hypothetical protein [Candidatus Eremiobacteraeota bacterium]
MTSSSSFFLAAAAGVAAGTVLVLGTPAMRSAAVAATPPPTPPPIGTPATPQPGATILPAPTITPSPPAMPTMPSGKASATPSPPPNARKGLDGVWEVQIQHANITDYTHFAIKQQGDALTGTYLDSRGKKYPIAGSVDGQSVRLIVSMPNGTTLLLEGKLDGTTDMVGMLTMPDGQLPFTAAYRAKEKWIENVNPSPGGIPSQGGYTPP